MEEDKKVFIDNFKKIENLVKVEDGSLFYATNFSMGVNIFWKLNEYLAQIMNTYPNYNVELEEIHHLQKLDAPSGTAITTAEKIISKSL